MLVRDETTVQLNLASAGTDTPHGTEGIRMYWYPDDIEAVRTSLQAAGSEVSELVDREYGMREFTVEDCDGFSHCFGSLLPEEG
jgi:uncharacterized glyoxalase superfamily protein PhnB